MANLDRLTANPPPDRHEIGTEDGDICGRVHEPDDDAPRGYKPKPCGGEMRFDDSDATPYCDTCGEMP